MEHDPAPPYYSVTADDHAAWVVTTSLIFLIYSVMGVAGKIMLRFNLTVLKTPDICLLSCLAALVLQTALIISACRRGLGRHAAALSETNFDRFTKYYYAASIIGIAIEAVTKISICLWIGAISVSHRLLLANKILMGLIGAWAISGIFAVAFSCGLPHPWRAAEDGICHTRQSVYIYNGILNIVTDLAICVLPVAMMWNVRTTMRKKAQVCALFASRILVPPFTITALATASHFYKHARTDPTWYIVLPTIFRQISLNLSVLTACIPGLKSVLENIISGMAHARVQPQYDLSKSTDKKSRFLMTPADGSKHGGSGSGSGSKSKGSGLGSKIASKLRVNSSHQASHPRSTSHEDEITRSPSHGKTESTRNLTAGMIVRTDAFEVITSGNNSINHGDRSRSSIEEANEIPRVSPRF